MKLKVSALLGAVALFALTVPALAQPIQYQADDGINNTPVSSSTPLPVTGSISVTGATTIANGADVVEGSQNDSAACPSGTAKTIAGCLAQLHADATGAIPAGTNSIGTLNSSTAYGLQSAASTNSTSVKASAGTLTGITLLNTTTTVYYLRMYNLAAGPTCSSATGFVRTWPIPPAASAGLVGGVSPHLPVGGTAFSTGIAFCLTGGGSSTDNTNAATGVYVNLDYQ
jgi:hypothetical protein